MVYSTLRRMALAAALLPIASSALAQGCPGGSAGTVQYNNSGSCGGSSTLWFNNANGTLTATNLNAISTGGILLGGAPVLLFPPNDTNGASIAVGIGALSNNQSGGTSNVAVGNAALNSNSTGVDNVGVGALALEYNTTGYLNTAVGLNALNATTTGSGNTAVGANAGYSATTASNTTAIGFMALHSNNGARNVAVGYNALLNNTSGIDSVAVGASALAIATTANDNVAVGANALNKATTGGFNSALGDNACYLATGNDNLCLGYNSGFNGSFTSPSGLSSGTQNILVGESANITTGSGNIVIGNSLTGTTPSGNNQIDIGDQIVVANGVTTLTSPLVMRLPVTTVAALPACGAGQIGAMYAVSDAQAPTYNSPVTGGGTNAIPVFCNGSAWTAH
jgi:trimeric autotransporter adhesin